MSRAVFIHPDDNLSPVATGGTQWAQQTGTISSDPDYGAAKLGDLDAATPCKCTTVGPFAVVRDLGSAKQVDLAVVPMHTLDAGGTVRFQMNASNSWGAPSVDVACVVPAWLRTRPAMPMGLVFDLRAILLATRTQRWIRVSAPANATNIASFGEIAFGKASELIVNVEWGTRIPRQVITARPETPLGGRIGTYLGTLRRSVVGSIADTTDPGLLQLQDLYDAAADVTPFAFVFDPDFVDGRFVYWNNPFDPTLVYLGVNSLAVELIEQSRGRPF